MPVPRRFTLRSRRARIKQPLKRKRGTISSESSIAITEQTDRQWKTFIPRIRAVHICLRTIQANPLLTKPTQIVGQKTGEDGRVTRKKPNTLQHAASLHAPVSKMHIPFALNPSYAPFRFPRIRTPRTFIQEGPKWQGLIHTEIANVVYALVSVATSLDAGHRW
jgi:hypothetical protein